MLSNSCKMRLYNIAILKARFNGTKFSAVFLVWKDICVEHFAVLHLSHVHTGTWALVWCTAVLLC